MYSKTCVNIHSKIDKTNGASCNTFDLHLAIISLENHFWLWLFYTGFTVVTNSSLNDERSVE